MSQDFLRAVWGEIRHATGEVAPASPFLRLLQHCLDRADFAELDALRALARDTLRRTRQHGLLEQEEFPAEEWWLELPSVVSDIPLDWQPYNVGDAIVESGLRHLPVRTPA